MNNKGRRAGQGDGQIDRNTKLHINTMNDIPTAWGRRGGGDRQPQLKSLRQERKYSCLVEGGLEKVGFQDFFERGCGLDVMDLRAK